jgi:hypothetical protein
MSLVKSTLTLNSTAQPPASLSFSRSSAATRLNNIGLVELVSANEIRQDYYPNDIGHIKGWLLEESSTNSLLQSQDFGTTWITTTSQQTNNGSVSTNNVRSPDGTANADLLSSSSTATAITAVRQQGVTFTSGQTYTVSVYAKKRDYNFLEISNRDNNDSGMTFSKVFNLSTGALGSSGGTVGAAEIMAHPNGWYRCQVTFTADANTDTELYFKARTDDATSTTYSTTNGQGIYLWGAQSENKPYATSYIPTTTVAVTRAADVAFIEDTDNKWNTDVGMTLWMDGATLNTTEVVSPLYHYQDTTNNNSTTFFSNAKYSVISGSNQQLDAAQFDAGFTISKHTNWVNTIAVSLNRVHASQNGSLAPNFPDTSVNLPVKTPSSDFAIKFFHGTGLNSGSGWLRGFRIYPNIINDLDLQNVSFRGHQDAQQLALQAVTTVDGSISAQKLADGAVTSQKILDGTIVAADIATGGIETANIADDQITNALIAANAVTGTEIAPNSITSAHLGLDVIVAEDIAANAITVSELQDNAVTTAKILDNNVTGAKIAMGSDAQGDILYYDGTDYTRLAKGTTGHVLTQTATIPEWAADSTDVGGTSVGGDVNGTVSNIQINANAVGSAEIAANAVDTSEIATNAVGITELDVTDGSAGQLLSTNGSGVLSFITDPTNVGATAVGGDLSGSVANAQIVANAVGTPELSDDAVTAAELASNAVVTASIVDLNVTEGKLANDSVTANKLKDSASDDSVRAVTTNHIKNLNVTEGKLAAGAVTGTKIANNTITSAHIVDATITDADLGTNAVTNTKIANLAINGSKIQSNAITTSKIADNQVTIAKLAVTDGTNGQVLTTDGNGVLSFANDSTNVGGTAVGGDVTGTVSNITIPAGAITSAMIGVDVIVAEDIANNAITVAELSDNAVSTAKIQANAVDGTKIAMGSDARGDVLYYNGTDYVRLAKGTSGQVLTMGANDPAWLADSTNVGGSSVGGDLTGTVGNAQIASGAVGITELDVTDGSAGQLLSTNGSGVLSFITDPTNVGGTAVGGDLSGTVSNAQIIANAVTSTEIAANAVGISELNVTDGTSGQYLTTNGNGVLSFATDSTNVGGTAVGGDVSGTVSNIQINANAVDGTHIALGSDAAGDVMYYNGTDYVRLAKGTAGQVLTINSGATAPEWAVDSTNVGNTAVGGDVTGTVSNITIPTNSIDGTHLALSGQQSGDVMYYNGTDWVRLAKGTAGQVLTVNSGATAPEWAADSTSVGSTAVGGMVSGTVSNISISAGVVTPTMLSATGTANNTTFLRGDGVWAAPTMTETDPTAVTMAIALG